MGPMHTAILHLREPATPIVRRVLLPALATVRGVRLAEYDPADALIEVTFNTDETRLPDLVRLVEDSGSAVAAVSERSARMSAA